MSTGGLESMIFHVFAVVFFDGFLLMLVILSAMRALYALGVCQRPQISTDHVRRIPLERFEKPNTPDREINDGGTAYNRSAGRRQLKYRPTARVGKSFGCACPTSQGAPHAIQTHFRQHCHHGLQRSRCQRGGVAGESISSSNAGPTIAGPRTLHCATSPPRLA